MTEQQACTLCGAGGHTAAQCNWNKTDGAQGHGHVTPRADGFLARCGGPGICKVCQAEQAEGAQGEREAFRLHLTECAAEVSTWPDYKRNSLGQISAEDTSDAASFLRVAEAGMFKDHAAALGLAAIIIRGLLERPDAMQLVRKHRIAVTPEYEGQWHADLYADEAEVQKHAEGDSPEAAVLALFDRAALAQPSTRKSHIAEALRAADWSNTCIGNKVLIEAAIEHLEAQPSPAPELGKQEPVAEVVESGGTLTAVIVRHSYATKLPVGTKLYAVPAAQAGQVPEKPTDAMLQAGMNAMAEAQRDGSRSLYAYAGVCWDAMIAAAPAQGGSANE